jgi:hypothetical protein
MDPLGTVIRLTMRIRFMKEWFVVKKEFDKSLLNTNVWNAKVQCTEYQIMMHYLKHTKLKYLVVICVL